MNRLSETSASFALGEWTIHPARDLLVRSAFGRGEQKRVTPLEMKLLLRLAEEPGRVMSKALLLDEVWEGAAVVDHVLAKTMSKLRASLGDDARNPRFIETVGRRGYRLIASPTPIDVPPVRPARRDLLVAKGRRLLPAAAVLVAFVAGLSGPAGESPIEIAGETGGGPSESAPYPSAPVAERVQVPVRISLPLSEAESGSLELERHLWKFEIASSNRRSE